MTAAPTPNPICQLLPWDSEFFGLTIARASVDTLTPTSAAAIDQWCLDHQVRCLYFPARADDPQTPPLAEQHGYHLVDLRLTFEKQLTSRDRKGAVPPETPDHSLTLATRQESPIATRLAVESDTPTLRALARAAHTDTRFWFDPHFTPQQSAALYDRWMTRSLEGYAQAVLVTGHPGQPSGYITLHHKPGAPEGSIGLIAVAESARGQGLGQILVNASLNFFAERGASLATVVTQARNIPAQRLYQRTGFVTKSLQLYYHKWYDRELAAGQRPADRPKHQVAPSKESP